MKSVQRRSFLKTTASVAAVAALPQVRLSAQEAAATPAATVVVVHGKDIPKMLEAGIAKLGGWAAFIKPGNKVALKPNVAWNSLPEQGGNTHPDLIRACVLAAEAKGASSITIPENTCHPEKATFKTSGVENALKGTKARLYRPAKTDYQKVDIPQGKSITSWDIYRDVLETDVLIDVPIAKNHSLARLTLGGKNLLGVISDPNQIHSALGQRIAGLVRRDTRRIAGPACRFTSQRVCAGRFAVPGRLAR